MDVSHVVQCNIGYKLLSIQVYITNGIEWYEALENNRKNIIEPGKEVFTVPHRF